MTLPTDHIFLWIQYTIWGKLLQGNIAIFMGVFIFFIAKKYIKRDSKSAYAEFDAHFLNDSYPGYLNKTKISNFFPYRLSHGVDLKFFCNYWECIRAPSLNIGDHEGIL